MTPVMLLEYFEELSTLDDKDYDKYLKQEELDYLIDLIQKDITEVD